jgi:hypothetical protein
LELARGKYVLYVCLGFEMVWTIVARYFNGTGRMLAKVNPGTLHCLPGARQTHRFPASQISLPMIAGKPPIQTARMPVAPTIERYWHAQKKNASLIS